jgi:hypothetical protein
MLHLLVNSGAIHLAAACGGPVSHLWFAASENGGGRVAAVLVSDAASSSPIFAGPGLLRTFHQKPEYS